MFKLLADRQIALFCFIYFSIALTIYGATFWLPSMIKKMGNLGDFQVGLFNSIPWIISIVAMYGFAAMAGKWKHPAGVGRADAGDRRDRYVHVDHWRAGFAFVAICFAAIGFKAASALFWPIPQSYLDARIAAAVIALINSIGNLGGFVAPTAFGFLEQTTGSIEGGLYGLAATSLVAAVVIFFARTTPGRQRQKPRKAACKSRRCRDGQPGLRAIESIVDLTGSVYLKITRVTVTPIAFRDPPLLNASGIHEPFALRSIIEIESDNGYIGLGESYGDAPALAIQQQLQAS
jgi:hypothetical protein